MLSLGATPNSSYTKGDRAFRASKSMSVSSVGPRNSFQLLGTSACRAEFRFILEHKPGLRHHLFLCNLAPMQIEPAYIKRELLHAPRANPGWTCKGHLHSSGLQSSIPTAQKHKQNNRKDIENGYLLSADLHPLLYCSDSKRYLPRFVSSEEVPLHQKQRRVESGKTVTCRVDGTE